MKSPQVLTGPRAKLFLLGGKASFTLRNTETGNRETYKIISPKEGQKDFMVFSLVGQNYLPLGRMTSEGGFTPRTPASRIQELIDACKTSPRGDWVDGKGDFLETCKDWTARSRELTPRMSFRLSQALKHYGVGELPPESHAKILNWVSRKLFADDLPESIEVWHEGTCCCCARPLTVPASIELGMGPDCARERGFLLEWQTLNKKPV